MSCDGHVDGYVETLFRRVFSGVDPIPDQRGQELDEGEPMFDGNRSC